MPATCRRLAALVTACALLSSLSGCGGGGHTAPKTVGHQAVAASVSVPAYLAACPQAASGHGQPGICGPRGKLGLLAPHPTASLTTYVDLSNNDPCYCGPTLKAQGYRGLIAKINQGTGFIDWTAAAMVTSARAAGLPVGGYDFDQDYTVAEAQVFASHLHALGIDPKTPNTFPVYLDVEYGAFSLTGLQAQINYLRGLGYRVGIYTGGWYWTPHAGCRWPTGLNGGAWLSGYPNAIVPCGVTGFNVHQFTSTPFDKDAYFGGQSFAAFTNAPVPPPPPPARLICFPKASNAAKCAPILKQVAGWQSAAKASQNAVAGTQRVIDPLLKRKAMFAHRVTVFNGLATAAIRAHS